MTFKDPPSRRILDNRTRTNKTTMAVKEFVKSAYPTSIVHLKSISVRGKSECPLFVWIPGNPGLIEYYEEFLMLIHRRHPEWEVLGISQAGMSTASLKQSNKSKCQEVYSLQQQIDHKIDVIRDFSSPTRPLIIMGHSVGAYMVQHVALSERLVGKVVKIGLLTPTILDIHTSTKGVALCKIIYWLKDLPNLAGWISSLLFGVFLPSFLLRLILSMIMGCHRNSSAVVTTEILIRNGEFVRQALGLAMFEMEEIRSDWEFQRRLIDHCNKNKIFTWILFSESDHWVADTTREDLIKFYRDQCYADGIKIHIGKLPHSFVLKHSKYLIDKYFDDC